MGSSNTCLQEPRVQTSDFDAQLTRLAWRYISRANSFNNLAENCFKALSDIRAGHICCGSGVSILGAHLRLDRLEAPFNFINTFNDSTA